jgi:hypothetical protein
MSPLHNRSRSRIQQYYTPSGVDPIKLTKKPTKYSKPLHHIRNQRFVPNAIDIHACPVYGSVKVPFLLAALISYIYLMPCQFLPYKKKSASGHKYELARSTTTTL